MKTDRCSGSDAEEEVLKLKKEDTRFCQEKSKCNSISSIYNICQWGKEASRIQGLQWSAGYCDCCQEELRELVPGDQLQRVNVDDVIGFLAKSEAARRKLERDLKESLRREIVLPTVK